MSEEFPNREANNMSTIASRYCLSRPHIGSKHMDNDLQYRVALPYAMANARFGFLLAESP